MAVVLVVLMETEASMPAEAMSPLWGEWFRWMLEGCGTGLAYKFRVPEPPVVMVMDTE